MKKNIFKHDFILKECKDKKILHIGATDYPYHIDRANKGKLLHQKLKKVSNNLIGLDINKEAINQLKDYNINDIYFGDVVRGDYEDNIEENEYDIIVFGDVIEHLDNPGLALKNIKELMSNDTKVIMTTPNVWGIFRITNYFKSIENVHPDHTFWPSKKTTTNLIKNNGLNIHKFKYLMTGSSNDSITIKGKIFKKLFLDNIPNWRGVLCFVLNK